MGLLSFFVKSDGHENIRKAYKQLSSAQKFLFQNSYVLFEETICDLIEIFRDNNLILGGIPSILEITEAYIFTLRECAQKRRSQHVVAEELKHNFSLFDSDPSSKQFVAYSLLKASHANFRLNQENGKASIQRMVQEMVTASARKIQGILWKIVDEQNGSEDAYFDYLLKNNIRNIPEGEIKAFVGLMAYSESNSKKDTVTAFRMYIEELINSTPVKTIPAMTSLLDICSFFCGLLNRNEIITESEMKEISDEYTKRIVAKKMAE